MRHLVASLALLCATSLAAHAASSPQETAQAFYSARLKSPVVGAPGGMDLASWSPWLGPELICLLGAARRYNDAFSATNPSEPPPFADGDLFSSAPTTPDRFNLGALEQRAGRATLQIEFLVDQPDSPSRAWEDRLHMIQHKSRWVINDIEYQDTHHMADTGRLVTNLRKTLGAAPALPDWDARQLEGCPQGNELARLKAEQQRLEARAKAKKAKAKKKTNSTKKPASSTKKAAPQKTPPKK